MAVWGKRLLERQLVLGMGDGVTDMRCSSSSSLLSPSPGLKRAGFPFLLGEQGESLKNLAHKSS